ncbi:hypothetical protein [Streptomyces sp. AC555_RSS877]|uniref:hypothetical protein n=1 Tax=Streptomyces sp. AC555_RSS877 TaxID=2823688 RepID=UPI001C259272|nr:hypothetical protein [Streptomyces sp. AC555_RSS877]
MWADLLDQQDVALAVRRRAFAGVAGDSLGIGASGRVALPLPGSDGPVGVLSVLTTESGERDETQRSLLRALAGRRFAHGRCCGLLGRLRAGCGRGAITISTHG